jgi:site-specific recombinase XerD
VLDNDQLKSLYSSIPQTSEQEKAKDFWFFSYAANGMNIKDIALLKYKNIHDSYIVFYRAKICQTSKSDLKPTKVYLNDYLRSIIEQYGIKPEIPESYIFGIIDPYLTPLQKQIQIKNFTRFINQHIKKLALNVGLAHDISTYWARHSFATNSIRNGASMEYIQESLGHNSLKTTQQYFAGFDNDTKKEFGEKLMDF